MFLCAFSLHLIRTILPVMKYLLAFCLITTSGYAQGTFRIFDDQMNDVTTGVVFVLDTNASQMQLTLTVENIDTVTHNVTAGRLVISQPATASNAFIWGPIQYTPNIDSSVASTFINSGNTETFEGLYFPNNNGGTATINYCFWERTDMNNNSCVTVTYDHYFPAGTTGPINSPAIVVGPNPAADFIGFGWSDPMQSITIYSSTGTLVASRDLTTDKAEFDLTDWDSGLYFYLVTGVNGFVISGTFVH
jgi:hypothetical protein